MKHDGVYWLLWEEAFGVAGLDHVLVRPFVGEYFRLKSKKIPMMSHQRLSTEFVKLVKKHVPTSSE